MVDTLVESTRKRKRRRRTILRDRPIEKEGTLFYVGILGPLFQIPNFLFLPRSERKSAAARRADRSFVPDETRVS